MFKLEEKLVEIVNKYLTGFKMPALEMGLNLSSTPGCNGGCTGGCYGCTGTCTGCCGNACGTRIKCINNFKEVSPCLN